MTTIKREPKPIHRYISVDELIEKYMEASRLEVDGLLHALGEYTVYQFPNMRAIDFLCKVGDNGDRNNPLWENDHGARATARRVLVRKVVKELNEWPYSYQEGRDSPVFLRLVSFFAKSETHCSLDNNQSDRKILAAFVSACWEQWSDRGLHLRELVQLTIYAGCADLLPNEPGVRTLLYRHLLKEMSRDGAEQSRAVALKSAEILSFCGRILALHGHHHDEHKKLATRLLQLQALSEASS